MSVRENFVAKFGEGQALAVEAAAEEHATDTNGAKRGTDPFKWALLICIGFECMSKDAYRDHHAIVAPWDDLRKWIKEHGQLGTHDGDCDYLCMFAGGYNEFMPEKVGAA